MSFQPLIPLGGYGGWLFLSKTLPSQQATHAKSPTVARAESYFRENITKATTPEALVKDRRLLDVALTAFGLQDDINAKAFIQKVLEGGTIKSDALASRLSDKRYAQFAFAFGYGNTGARVHLRGFADEILSRYKAKSFEAAVGTQDENLRLALNFDAAMRNITTSTTSERAQWFTMMGDAPLRKVFESALGLPSSFGALDIDQQLTQFQQRLSSTFGTSTFADMAQPEHREKMIRLFLVRADLAAQGGGYSKAQTALTLLQGLTG